MFQKVPEATGYSHYSDQPGLRWYDSTHCRCSQSGRSHCAGDSLETASLRFLQGLDSEAGSSELSCTVKGLAPSPYQFFSSESSLRPRGTTSGSVLAVTFGEVGKFNEGFCIVFKCIPNAGDTMSLEQLSKIYTHKHRYIHKEMMGENKAYTYMGQLFSSCVLRKLPKKKKLQQQSKKRKATKIPCACNKIENSNRTKTNQKKKKSHSKVPTKWTKTIQISAEMPIHGKNARRKPNKTKYNKTANPKRDNKNLAK